ncbi:hypothetical protein EKH80_03055 [Dyella choica]|uniref:Uncharacterized protein n=1 Tax=Dyella choica TaxID=1927959 RepID=A0A3S0Q6S7_9GAMM|nr:hypothetical protein EKH80_03055 [Dyella choica]
MIDQDQLKIDSAFGHRMVTITASPAVIRGSGQATVGGKKVCIAGDESKVNLNATYTAPGFANSGVGVVTIVGLDASQLAPGCTSGAALITRGGAGAKFNALLTVTTPASNPTPPGGADPATPGMGTGEFAAQQDFANAGSP